MPSFHQFPIDQTNDAIDAHLRSDRAVNQYHIHILDRLRDPERGYDAEFRGLAIENENEILGVTIHSVPGDAIISAMTEETARELGTEHARRFPDIRGVTGPEPCAWAFVRGAGADVEETTVIMQQGLFTLERVSEVPAASGRCRPAEPSDAEQLQTWLKEFVTEALPTDPPPGEDAGERLASSGRCHVWEREDGIPTSFTNNPRRVCGLWAIGPVYTPPEHRGCGYASSLVEHVSRYALANGADACTLFTDLANPVSNRIYERIGYRRAGSFATLRWP